jgi:hypothetical protein
VYHGGVPTLRLTGRALDTLPLPSRGRVEYFDEYDDGLTATTGTVVRYG